MISERTARRLVWLVSVLVLLAGFNLTLALLNLKNNAIDARARARWNRMAATRRDVLQNLDDRLHALDGGERHVIDENAGPEIP